MSYIMIDIESDGPIPSDYSMISFGAVLVNESLDQTFYRRLKPVSDRFLQEALDISGFTREETLLFDDPGKVINELAAWLKQVCTEDPIFISDNNGYDWMFICWYFHHFTGSNPFGHSSQNLGSLYKGIVKDASQNFKHLRKTKHTHNPLDDAIGNAEALIALREQYGMKIRLK
jgi:3' exoribonuclease, RNase T-like